MSTMRSTNEAKRAELRGVQRSPSDLQTTQIQHKDAAAASHPLDCNPLPRWGGLFQGHSSSAPGEVSSTFGVLLEGRFT
jgi:hypothetical protein